MSLIRIVFISLLFLSGQAWGGDVGEQCRIAAGFDDKDIFDITGKGTRPEALALCQAAVRNNPDEDKLKAYLGWALYGAGRNTEARQWIEKSQETRLGRALMGLSYEYGIGVARDLAQAYEWYSHPPHSWSWTSHPVAATQAMLFSLNGWGGASVTPRSWVYDLLKAAEQGYDRAQYFYGRDLQQGPDTRKDLPQAINWYRKAAAQGNAEALQALKGLVADGNAQAYLSLALAYVVSRPPLKDPSKARALLEQAVEAERTGTLRDIGDREEQLSLGAIHGYLGHEERAAHWFRKAAEQGQSDAQWNLADRLATGKGVDQDLTQADLWYRKSAMQGNAAALELLKQFYQDHPDIERRHTAPNPKAPAGAFCACEEPDAFPGVAKGFNSIQLNLIQETYETLDPRQKIDRTAPRFKPLNAIGQVVVLHRISGEIKEVGFGTGILLPGNLVLTNAHVVKDVDTYVRFNIGQTGPNAPNRWADSIIGQVITLGSSIGSIPSDWALIQLDTSKVNWNKKYGSISPFKLREDGFQEASQNGQLITAGYPGLKDPRYLWGQIGVQSLAEEDSKDPKIEPSKLNAATSSGVSGAAVLYEYQPGQFKLVGLVRGGPKDTANIIIDKTFAFNSESSDFVNFKDPRFSETFGDDYKKILKGTF